MLSDDLLFREKPRPVFSGDDGAWGCSSGVKGHDRSHPTQACHSLEDTDWGEDGIPSIVRSSPRPSLRCFPSFLPEPPASPPLLPQLPWLVSDPCLAPELLSALFQKGGLPGWPGRPFRAQSFLRMSPPPNFTKRRPNAPELY